MLEILLVVFLGQKLGKKAQARGLSKNYGWLIVPFWIVPEFMGAFILGLMGADLLVVYIGALAGAGIGAVIAFQVIDHMGPGTPVVAAMPAIPAYGASVPPPPPATAALRPQAGLCSECGETVWLTPNGACSRGHGPECISGQYTPGV